MNLPENTRGQKLKKIIIFGCSQSGAATFNRIKGIRRINIIGFTDNNPDKWGSLFMERPVFTLKEAMDAKADFIFIASEWHEEIYRQLITLNIDPQTIKIVPTRIRRANSFGNGLGLKLAESILVEISTFLKSRSIGYYLHSGTLLGAVREKRLLPWDYDLDIFIEPIHSKYLEEISLDFARVIKEKYQFQIDLKPHFYSGNWKQMSTKVPARIFLTITNKVDSTRVQLDLVKIIEHNGKHVWALEDLIYCAPSSQFQKGTELNFLDHNFTVPAEYKEFLTTMYGDWSKPIKNWDHKFQKNSAINPDT